MTTSESATPSGDPKNDHCTTIECIAYNCKAFKQNLEYIADLLCQCDVLCITETWLRPGELVYIKQALQSHSKLTGVDFEVFAKSSMENNPGSCTGRPFGGIATIVKTQNGVNVRELDNSNERALITGLYDTSNRLIQVVCNVYMPFYDTGNSHCTEEYLDSLNVLQSVIDKYGAECPVRLLGDFNAQIPRSVPSHDNWYKHKGFNRHSRLLWDFMSDNDVVAVDMLFPQPVNYTYFCDKRGAFTWLDHIICTQNGLDSIIKCRIIERSADNDSDHLPVSVSFEIQAIPESGNAQNSGKDSIDGFPVQMPIRWTEERIRKYNALLCGKLKDIVYFDINENCSAAEAKAWANGCILSLCNAISNSAKECEGNNNKRFKPKPYWSPELSVLRDRKRFWWKMWNNLGRPRKGAVFDVYKSLKKKFRKLCRDRVNSLMEGTRSKLNELYYSRRMKSFWNHIKRSRKSTVNSKLHVDTFARFYSNIMNDAAELSDEQGRIASDVDRWFNMLVSDVPNHNVNSITKMRVSSLIDELNNNCAPGIDGVTSEHLKHGKSDILCSVLSNLFTTIMSYHIVPDSFCMGVIVPVLKKPGLNTNDTGSFRPVTLSTTFSKMLERLMIPSHKVSDTQFGFRKGTGTSFACSLYNDVSMYFRHKKSPLYTCSLDAEKCFDTIWHKGLFYKLYGKIPNDHWVLLYKWYSNLKATVKWKGKTSQFFDITKGTRQGSILSPYIFNIFIDDLLQELDMSNDKVRIGTCSLNSFAYADDVNLICTTAPGLQRLINICTNYADRWRFRFSISKTKCMVTSGSNLCARSVLYLKGERIEMVTSLEMLGVCFSRNGDAHVKKRKDKCRRLFYSLRDIGMAYPGCASDVKAYMWNTMCKPALSYGLDSIYLDNKCFKELETCQGNLAKQALGFSKRSKSSSLLQGLGITKMRQHISQCTASLFRRIFLTKTPIQSLCRYFLSLYITRGSLVPGTIVDRLVSYGLSPTRCAFIKYSVHSNVQCGIVDSLRHLLMHENFVKPYSEEHILATLLTKSF